MNGQEHTLGFGSQPLQAANSDAQPPSLASVAGQDWIRRDREVVRRQVVAPRTALERQMVELWQRVLRMKSIGVTDDFFELGGYSLHACMLMTQIRQEFGWEIPFEQWLMRPTVEGTLAIRRSVEEESPKRRFLVFNASGGQPPLVLFPGLCGSPASYRGLPEALGSDQPLYLADSLDVEAPQELLVASIEHMADAYEADLQRLCPTRTLILGGYSFGMLLVLELARRMLTHGYSVPLLVSIESAAPNYPKFLPTKQRVLAHLREIGFGEQRRYIADRLSNTYRRLLRSLHREYLLMPHVRASSSEVRQVTKRLFDVSIGAIQRYQPRFTVDSDLLFFRVHTSERRIGVEPHDLQAGWSSYIGGNITVVPIAGEHGTILSSANREVIARRYQQHIDGLGLSVQKTPQVRA